MPEVKGLSLEEVDELYRANIKPWKSASWRPASRGVSHGKGRRVVHGEIVDDDDDESDAVSDHANRARGDQKTPRGGPEMEQNENEKTAVEEKQVENA